MNKKLQLPLDQLNGMKGRQFTYAKQDHTVKNIIIDDVNEKFTIVTDLSRFDRKFEAGIEFLSYWKPIEVSHSIQLFDSKDNVLADDMIAILKDNIEKVQTDAKYIPQAHAINNNVNSIINIVKTKLDFAKAMRSK